MDKFFIPPISQTKDVVSTAYPTEAFLLTMVKLLKQKDDLKNIHDQRHSPRKLSFPLLSRMSRSLHHNDMHRSLMEVLREQLKMKIENLLDKVEDEDSAKWNYMKPRLI